jgi:probable HAF family extracellular repeat protein
MIGLGGFGPSFNYVAYGINDANQAVGSQVIDGSGTLRAAFWSTLSATPSELSRPVGYSAAEAFEISRSGMIVGDAKNPSGNWRAMRWDNSTSIGFDLGMLGTVSSLESYAYGARARIVGNTSIESNGSIVGKSQSSANGVYRAFLTPWNRGIFGASDDISGGEASEAHAINGLGQVVGSRANGATPEHAWMWIRNPDGTLSSQELAVGNNFSRAMAINNRGQVVGWVYSSGTTWAFLWTPGTGIRDLKSSLPYSDQLNWNLYTATGITDDGTVVGYGTQANGGTNTWAFARWCKDFCVEVQSGRASQ